MREGFALGPALPLYLLITSQAAFFIFGKFFLDFNIGWVDAGVVLLVALFAEFALSNTKKFGLSPRKFQVFFPASAMASALGIIIFFRASNPAYFAAAAFVAIASKYVLRHKGNHIFNPSNIAIVLMVFAFPYASSIEFTQWGSNYVVFALISGTALVVAYFARVLLTTFLFLFTYTALLYVFIGFNADHFSLHHFGLLSPTLVLFAAYMITDPKTSPQGSIARVLHGVSVAGVYFTLEFIGIAYALFVASLIVTILNALSRYILDVQDSRFSRFAPNALSGVVSVGLCVVVLIMVVGTHPYSIPANRISSQYVLFGLESPRIKSCRANPVLVSDPQITFVGKPHTSGAAWGDFNGDGYDDLFVSNTDEPSRLYKNVKGERFVDVTSKVGIPPMRAFASAFVDYDNNGTLDLIVLEEVIKTEHSKAVAYNVPRIFKNSGGMFTDVSKKVGLSGVELGTGAGLLTVADYDNNGYLDMVVSTLGTIRQTSPNDWSSIIGKVSIDPYFRKNYGYMICGTENISRALGSIALNESQKTWLQDVTPSISTGIPCVQYLKSLPLVPFSWQTGIISTNQASVLRTVEPGTLYLFKNSNGKFSLDADFTQRSYKLREHMLQITAPDSFYTGSNEIISGRYYQPVSFDYDEDGKPDILVSGDFGNSLLLKNTGNFTFQDATVDAGITTYGSAMGASVSDWNRDGVLDISLSNNRNTYLYTSVSKGTYSNQYAEMGLGSPRMGWGISFLDYNLDGWDDLFVSNGAYVGFDSRRVFEPRIRPIFLTDTLFANQAGEKMKDESGEDFCPAVANGYTIAVSDFDNDGDPDIFSGTMGSGNVIYKDTISHENIHYLKISLQGTQSNRMGVGSVVRVQSGGSTQAKVVLVGSGNGGENSQTLLFGLGTSTEPVKVQVKWPSGRTTEQVVQMLDRTIHIVE